jgi:hypothetical protein
MYLPFEGMSFLKSLLPPSPKNEDVSAEMSLEIASLDEDSLFHIFSYLTASDLDFGASLSCKALR